MTTLLTAAALLTALMVAWLLTTRRRTLALTSAFASAHPMTSQRLDSFLHDVDYAEDAEFYRCFGQQRGMWQRRRNAADLLHAWQVKAMRGEVNTDDVLYFSGRSWLINLFAIVSGPEAVLRRIVPSVPHICARTVAVLHREVLMRTRTVAAAHGIPLAAATDAVV